MFLIFSINIVKFKKLAILIVRLLEYSISYYEGSVPTTIVSALLALSCTQSGASAARRRRCLAQKQIRAKSLILFFKIKEAHRLNSLPI